MLPVSPSSATAMLVLLYVILPKGSEMNKTHFSKDICYFAIFPSRPSHTKPTPIFHRFKTPSVVVFSKRYPLHLRRHFWKRHSSSGAGRRSLGWWHLWCSLGHSVDIWVIPVYPCLSHLVITSSSAWIFRFEGGFFFRLERF